MKMKRNVGQEDCVVVPAGCLGVEFAFISQHFNADATMTATTAATLPEERKTENG